MNYVFIGDSFPKQYDQQFTNMGKFNFSNTIFNNLVVDSLKKTDNTFVLSAPYVGHYPIFSKTKKINEIKIDENHYIVKYNNLIGINAYSKAKNLIKCFNKNCNFKSNINFLVSETHLHNMKAAIKLKKKCPNSKIVLLVFDLPDNVKGQKKSFIYSVMKKINNKKIYKLTRKMDGFIYLSEEMNTSINELNKPYFVVPGLADLKLYQNIRYEPHEEKIISYCGVLSRQFNVDNLVDAFELLPDSNLRLYLAGKGDVVEYIKQKNDPRIKYLGMLSRNDALKIQLSSDVLVNPRLPNEEYTDVSFPSKTFQYLLTYNPTVSYCFKSFPEDIKNLVIIPKTNSIKSLAETINYAVSMNKPSKDNIDNILAKYSAENFVNNCHELFEKIREN